MKKKQEPVKMLPTSAKLTKDHEAYKELTKKITAMSDRDRLRMIINQSMFTESR